MSPVWIILSAIDTSPETVRAERVPTLVNEELTTAEPNVVALRTAVPLTLYVLPEATFRFSLDFSEVLVWSYLNVLSGPILIPAPSARESVVAVDAIPTTKSAIVNVSELI